MSKNVFFILMILALIALNSACAATEKTNANANVNPATANQTTLPPEFKTEPVQPSGNQTPGIPPPNEANKVSNGTTPTPGIPDSTKMTPVPKGATPTPGIPDPATMKKQMKNMPMSSENPVIAPNSNSNVKQRIRKP